MSVADALRRHGPALFTSLGPMALGPTAQKVLGLMTACRTGKLGGVLYRCGGCGREHWAGRSCGNRHCTTCGHEKTQDWIEKQRTRLMPVHHFLVTFTLPRELGSVLRAGDDETRRNGYRCLFDAGSDSIRDVASATKSLRDCRLGYFGVLHTWGRDPMVYHPHVHFVVPGGGVKPDQAGLPEVWQATPENFLFHHGTLVKVYKVKLTDELRQCGLYDKVPAEVWDKKLVVDIKPVGSGSSVLKYLAPYVHRVAISDKRIVSVDDSHVRYTVRPSGSNKTITKRVDGETFVRGFAQHILPPGFQKVRHYGWMSANTRIGLDAVALLVWIFLGWRYWLASGHAPSEKPLTAQLRCARCGGPMHVVAVVPDAVSVEPNFRVLTYFDSG